MKFGYFFPSPKENPDETWEQVTRDSWEQMELADTAFDYLWFPEHHFTTTYVSPAPLLNVIDAARRTKNARIGAAVILTPFYHPLILAEQIGLADQLTEGRLEVAFGRGTYSYEYSRLGMTAAEASARQREELEILLGVWAKDEEYEYHGKYYDFPPTYPVPRPVQQPHPRIGVAGRTTETLRFVVEHDLDLHTTPLRQPMSRVYANLNLLDSIVKDMGRTRRPRVSCQRETFVTDSKKEALEVMEYLHVRYAAAWRFQQENVRVHKAHAIYEPIPEEFDISPQDFIDRSVVGDPATCIERLKEYEELGFDEFITVMDYGQPQELVMKSMERFINEVLPAFKGDRSDVKRRAPVLVGAGAGTGWDGRSSGEIKQALLMTTASQIAPGWREWEARDWLSHFETIRKDGEPSAFYVFDYDCAPYVRGDGGGFVAEDRLMLLRDDACPDCGRPVIALYRRWDHETPKQMRARVQERLRAMNWHAIHP
jgi:alkanesulfonate monooxygenase SsuD/methylene tetrahydromethanopterin reductase-like flavin-dependent oxidoreductase (luciferase family)